MSVIDNHLDILQNIEFNIARAYEQDIEMKDANARRTLEALEKYYRAKGTDKEAERPENLNESKEIIFDNVITTLEMRCSSPSESDAAPKRPRFSRAFKEPTLDEIFVACIRKLISSSNKWSKRNGDRGYLDFIKNHV